MRLSMCFPDDCHLHLRDGAELRSVLPDTASRFARAIIMPNLNPPITTTGQALAYRDRILNALPAGQAFEPLMTLYLTEATLPEEIAAAKASGFIHAVKCYPAGATTHSARGVRELRRCYPVFEAMQLHGVPLLLHGEVTDPAVDAFDREDVFIERYLVPLLQDFPGLRVVLEHITTREAVEFVRAATGNLAATITAHHLLLNRNAMFSGGFRPHHYCLPLLKRESHRQALISAATSGDRKFFLGTDSAPHPRHAKESDCGCAGIYTAHAALELYAEVFESVGALDRLEGFASFHGADFYGLPRNAGRLTIERKPWIVPREISLGENSLIPFRAGESVTWKLVETHT